MYLETSLLPVLSRITEHDTTYCFPNHKTISTFNLISCFISPRLSPQVFISHTANLYTLTDFLQAFHYNSLKRIDLIVVQNRILGTRWRNFRQRSPDNCSTQAKFLPTHIILNLSPNFLKYRTQVFSVLHPLSLNFRYYSNTIQKQKL